jgi:hypothetical protein
MALFATKTPAAPHDRVATLRSALAGATARLAAAQGRATNLAIEALDSPEFALAVRKTAEVREEIEVLTGALALAEKAVDRADAQRRYNQTIDAINAEHRAAIEASERERDAFLRARDLGPNQIHARSAPDAEPPPYNCSPIDENWADDCHRQRCREAAHVQRTKVAEAEQILISAGV